MRGLARGYSDRPGCSVPARRAGAPRRSAATAWRGAAAPALPVLAGLPAPAAGAAAVPAPAARSVHSLSAGSARSRSGVVVHAATAAAPLPVLPPSVGADADKFRFAARNGGMVYAAVDTRDEELTVTVTVPAECLPDGADPQLQWGMFRVPGGVWQHPADVVPAGSAKDASSGAMRSAMAYDKRRDVWELQLRIRRRLAPVQCAFDLHLPGMGATVGPRSGRHFVVPVGMGAGNPGPLGPSLVEVTAGTGPDATATLNFAVFSRHAASMSLCLLRADGAGYLEVGLDPLANRTGDVWHVQLRGLKGVGGLVYGWRAGGDKTWADSGSFHPAYIMLDPYCPRALPVTLPQAAYDSAPLLPPQGKLPGPVLLGSLAHLTESLGGPAPAADAGPRIALDESVLLELDVGAFTSGPDAERLVPPAHAGTYLGVVDRLPDIVASGATTVVLSNVFLSSLTAAPPPEPESDDPDAAPTAVWPTSEGTLRRPLSFFAPEVALAAGGDPGAAAAQLKAVIDALHGAGLEVLLEAEFCFTAEVAGGPGGRLQSMAGLDGDMYVRGGGGPRARGVLNTGQTVVRQLVRAALRHWVGEYGVDGFLLVHAENLAQGALGAVADSPPLLEELAADPLLRSVKLLASGGEPSLLPRGGERGVPHYGVLAEWNGRFARDIAALLRDNAGGHLSSLATRLMGSPDLTAARWEEGLPGGLAAPRRPAFSINALAPPGGAPLLSLAGGDYNLERGEVVARSMLLALAVAQGTPALNASVLARAGLRRFAAAALELRRKYRQLLAPPMHDSPRDITWHNASSTWEPDWSGEAAAAYVPGSNFIAFSVRGLTPAAAAPPLPSVPGAGAMAVPAPVPPPPAPVDTQGVYVAFNPNPEPVAVTLPPPPAGLQWRRLIDTSRLPPDDAVPAGAELLDREYVLAPGAALMLDAALRPPLETLSGSARASAVYSRLE